MPRLTAIHHNTSTLQYSPSSHQYIASAKFNSKATNLIALDKSSEKYQYGSSN